MLFLSAAFMTWLAWIQEGCYELGSCFSWPCFLNISFKEMLLEFFSFCSWDFDTGATNFVNYFKLGQRMCRCKDLIEWKIIKEFVYRNTNLFVKQWASMFITEVK